jgi:hypothetical protein
MVRLWFACTVLSHAQKDKPLGMGPQAVRRQPRGSGDVLATGRLDGGNRDLYKAGVGPAPDPR